MVKLREREYSLPKLVAFSSFVVMLAAFMVAVNLVALLLARGKTSTKIFMNEFGEFLPEVIMIAIGLFGLPVLLYELDRLAFD